MRLNVNFLCVLAILFLGSIGLQAAPAGILAQDDTVQVMEVGTPPNFDGIGNDECWQNKAWQTIDQVWIPWGTTMDPDDFSGRYKVIWSSTENLLYFLLEITDDVISDAYKPDGTTAAIYNFDMFEVFIDEDHSGGPHVYSTPENAFAYHTFTKFPADGETTTTFICDDMGSDYSSHFPSFILRQDGHVATWEFSLIVYNDTYTPADPESARSTLEDGKIIGLSVAFNDDDEPEVDPMLTERDNFIGSVWVPEENYNNHWMNADDFGTLKLVGDVEALNAPVKAEDKFSVYPNPASGNFSLKLANTYHGKVEIHTLDMEGRVLSSTAGMKTGQEFHKECVAPVSDGIYMIQVVCGQDILTQKITVGQQ